MATIQIEEAELGRLRQDSERVQSLESERDTLTRERDEAREALAARDRDAAITAVIESVEGHQWLTSLERRGLTADLPVTDDGSVDEAALRAAVEAAVADHAHQQGAGRVAGFGATTPTGTGDVTEADIDKAGASAFRRQVKEA